LIDLSPHKAYSICKGKRLKGEMRVVAIKNQETDIQNENQNSEAVLEKEKRSKNKNHKPAPKLRQISEIISEHNLQEAENIEITVLESIKSEFQKIGDPRHPSYVKHKLVDVLIIVLLAVIAGNNTWYEIEIFANCHKTFLTKLLGLENGVPTDDTYRLVICHIDMNFVYGTVIGILINKINNAVERYAPDTIPAEPAVLPFDGKASRSSGRKETQDQEKAKPLCNMEILLLKKFLFHPK